MIDRRFFKKIIDLSRWKFETITNLWCFRLRLKIDKCCINCRWTTILSFWRKIFFQINSQSLFFENDTKIKWRWTSFAFQIWFNVYRRWRIYRINVLNRTRVTLTKTTNSSFWSKNLNNFVKFCRVENKTLQLLFFNEKCLINANHQFALITFLKNFQRKSSIMFFETSCFHFSKSIRNCSFSMQFKN